MEVSTRYPTQPHLFDRRPSAFPLFGHHSRESHYSREMPSPYAPDLAHAQPYHHPSNREQPRVSLPSISDLLNFTGEPNSRRLPPASQPRTEPSWQQPRGTYGSQLKVETVNIDPRLHRPLSSPVPSSAHPGSAPVLQRSPMVQPSPAYARSADAEYAPHQLDYPSSFDHHKRLSTVSQISHLSQTSTQSADSTHSSPDVAKSTTSSYSHRGSLGEQRALPSDFPPPAHTSSPQRRIHSPTRDQHHPYAQTPSQRPTHQYAQSASQRPPLIHQSSAASIVTAASAGSSRLEDRYVCPSCNKAFSRPSSLRIHSHSHTGEKPFRCTRKGCGKAFSVRSNMKRHERGCHVDSAGYHSPEEEQAELSEHSP